MFVDCLLCGTAEGHVLMSFIIAMGIRFIGGVLNRLASFLKTSGHLNA